MNVARIAQSETRGKNWIQRQFRGETETLKHRFRSFEQTKRTSLQVGQSEVQSLRLKRSAFGDVCGVHFIKSKLKS